MSELSKRTSKYYFIQGSKMMGYILLLQLILCVEWFIMSSERDNLIDYMSRMTLMCGLMFMVLFNLIYAVYGPNWFDSIVLSMGGRRKDVFWGEMIKQFTFILCNDVVLILVAVATNKLEWIPIILMTSLIAAVTGAAGLVIGHKVKKYGKVYIFIIAIIAGCFGAFASVTTVLDINVLGMAKLSVGLIILVAVVLFVLFELWAYKLNQKSMVR